MCHRPIYQHRDLVKRRAARAWTQDIAHAYPEPDGPLPTRCHAVSCAAEAFHAPRSSAHLISVDDILEGKVRLGLHIVAELCLEGGTPLGSVGKEGGE